MRHSVKIISVIIALTVVIVGTSLIMQRVLAKTSTDLVESISGIEAGTSASNWKTAEKNLELVQKKWSRVSSTWSMLIDHQEIDNIEVTLSRMEKYIAAKDKPSALAEASALKNYINHIPTKETLNFKNVL